MAAFRFSSAVLRWFDREGRKHLPWQQDITPYRVWVSEIMLQQTQVATVIPYFKRFIKQFPTVKKLAAAEQDDVLSLWTGLGYYSRARNLHRAAQIIVDDFSGNFPLGVEALSQLPGIGRSTAGAIASIAQGQRAAILDGNVKRVLARFHAVAGWPGEPAVAKTLWQYAEQHVPQKRVGDYTQAMMDIGATVCTRSKPRCEACPLRSQCAAYWQDAVAQYPGRKLSKVLPVKSVQMLMIRNSRGEVLLQQRPPVGLWGGLWCFPEIPPESDAGEYVAALCGQKARRSEIWPGWRHSFSHYHLDIVPVLLTVSRTPRQISEPGAQWLHPANTTHLGLATPVQRLLAQLAASS